MANEIKKMEDKYSGSRIWLCSQELDFCTKNVLISGVPENYMVSDADAGTDFVTVTAKFKIPRTLFKNPSDLEKDILETAPPMNLVLEIIPDLIEVETLKGVLDKGTSFHVLKEEE